MSGAPTPGPWRDMGQKRCVVHGPHGFLIDCNVPSTYPVSPAEQEANTAFVAEAGTVLHETGLTPRQLVDQRVELLAACRAILSAGHDHQMPFDDWQKAKRIASAAIAKCEAGS